MAAGIKDPAGGRRSLASSASRVELSEHEAAAHTDEGESVRSSSLETKTGSGQSLDTAAVTSHAHIVL